MFSVGDKIVYRENGVCTVEKIAPLSISGSSPDKLYYYLRPLIGSGEYYAPVNSDVFMRPVMDRAQAEALIASIPGIEPAIFMDNRFNHVDAYYKELFKRHSCEALVAIVKGIERRMSQRKTKSSRAEATMRRAREMLHGELAVALGLQVSEVGAYIQEQLGSDEG